jgi:hypothetical protein
MVNGKNNPFAALKAAVTPPKPVDKRVLRHRKEREIIEHCRLMLGLSEAGQELLGFADENNIQFSILRGRAARDYAPNAYNAYVVVPDDMKMTDPDIVIHFVGALREAIQEHDPDLRRFTVDKGEQAYVSREVERFDDKMIWETIIVYELGIFEGRTEYIDSFATMGYYNLIESYEKDLSEN